MSSVLEPGSICHGSCRWGRSADGWGRMLTRDAAERVARNWWVLLVNGLLLIVAGVLIFSIDWPVRSLSIFIGALFILQGISTAFARGLDRSAEAINAVAAVLSMAAGVAIITWPLLGLVAVAVFLGAWLIMMGTITITGAFAARDVIPDWWLWLSSACSRSRSACSRWPTQGRR
jgi:uncharacterized membrane protein HdeD (DUF308 family)